MLLTTSWLLTQWNPCVFSLYVCSGGCETLMSRRYNYAAKMENRNPVYCPTTTLSFDRPRNKIIQVVTRSILNLEGTGTALDVKCQPKLLHLHLLIMGFIDSSTTCFWYPALAVTVNLSEKIKNPSRWPAIIGPRLWPRLWCESCTYGALLSFCFDLCHLSGSRRIELALQSTCLTTLGSWPGRHFFRQKI